jgi:hypothetical protein
VLDDCAWVDAAFVTSLGRSAGFLGRLTSVSFARCRSTLLDTDDGAFSDALLPLAPRLRSLSLEAALISSISILRLASCLIALQSLNLSGHADGNALSNGDTVLEALSLLASYGRLTSLNLSTFFGDDDLDDSDDDDRWLDAAEEACLANVVTACSIHQLVLSGRILPPPFRDFLATVPSLVVSGSAREPSYQALSKRSVALWPDFLHFLSNNVNSSAVCALLGRVSGMVWNTVHVHGNWFIFSLPVQRTADGPLLRGRWEAAGPLCRTELPDMFSNPHDAMAVVSKMCAACFRAPGELPRSSLECFASGTYEFHQPIWDSDESDNDEWASGDKWEFEEDNQHLKGLCQERLGFKDSPIFPSTAGFPDEGARILLEFARSSVGTPVSFPLHPPAQWVTERRFLVAPPGVLALPFRAPLVSPPLPRLAVGPMPSWMRTGSLCRAWGLRTCSCQKWPAY